MINYPLSVTSTCLSPFPLTCFYSFFPSTLWTRFSLVTSVMLRSEIGSLPLFFPCLPSNLPFPALLFKDPAAAPRALQVSLTTAHIPHSPASWSSSLVWYNPDQRQVANQQTSDLLAHNRSDSATIWSSLSSLKFGQKAVVSGGSWRQRIASHGELHQLKTKNGNSGTGCSHRLTQSAIQLQGKAQYCSNS